MFIPCSLVGLLIPRTVWGCFPLSQDVSVIKKSEEVQLNCIYFFEKSLSQAMLFTFSLITWLKVFANEDFFEFVHPRQ
jgi:hypothetical protein